MNDLFQILRLVGRDLDQLKVPWALIGALAVGAFGGSRFTRDVDLALAIDSDRAAEKLVFELRQLGYVLLRDEPAFEHAVTDRLAMVRLRLPHAHELEEVADLFFSLSGIETEIVEAAQSIELMPDLVVPVATRGDLMALKVLAGRGHDHRDFRWLLVEATSEDLARARRSIELIERRGYGGERNLGEDFEQLLALGPAEA